MSSTRASLHWPFARLKLVSADGSEVCYVSAYDAARGLVWGARVSVRRFQTGSFALGSMAGWVRVEHFEPVSVARLAAAWLARRWSLET
jgi:hypothetical protein